MRPSFVEYDGPYVFGDVNHPEILSFKFVENTWRQESEATSQTITVKAMTGVNSQDFIEFKVNIQHEISRQKSDFPMPSLVLAISDIEGNFIALYSWLTANGVIDKHANWIFGKGHLVLVGDLMDRGDQVTQLLWLIYKLQYEAKLQGGHVHCLLGNHDAMNFQMDLRYVHEKYLSLSSEFSKSQDRVEAYKSLWNPKNLLYRWMKDWPSMIKIGNFLFVHAGVSEDLIDAELTLDRVNSLSRKHIEEDRYGCKIGDPAANLIAGRMGPWWYRGMVEDYSNRYARMNKAQIENVKRFYKVDHIVVGHTVQEQICSSFDQSIIMIDVLHGWKLASGRTMGIEIKESKIGVVNDRAERWPLPALDDQL